MPPGNNVEIPLGEQLENGLQDGYLFGSHFSKRTEIDDGDIPLRRLQKVAAENAFGLIDDVLLTETRED